VPPPKRRKRHKVEITLAYVRRLRMLRMVPPLSGLRGTLDPSGDGV
jgi:hypothetical protein